MRDWAIERPLSRPARPFCAGNSSLQGSLTAEEFALKDILSLHTYQTKDLEVNKLTVDGHEAVKVRFDNKVGGYTGFVSLVYVRCYDRIHSFKMFSVCKVGGRSPSYDELHQLILRTLTIYYKRSRSRS
jgi:hypothetical protein